MHHTLTIPLKRPPMTANDQRRAHWTKQRHAKALVESLVASEARKAGIGKLGPATVTVTWYVPDRRRRDTDSLGPFLKATLDALVKCGVFEDDNSDHVTETRLAINKTDLKNPRIEIRIAEP